MRGARTSLLTSLKYVSVCNDEWASVRLKVIHGKNVMLAFSQRLCKRGLAMMSGRL